LASFQQDEAFALQAPLDRVVPYGSVVVAARPPSAFASVIFVE